jgi:hypothetical protein
LGVDKLQSKAQTIERLMNLQVLNSLSKVYSGYAQNKISMSMYKRLPANKKAPFFKLSASSVNKGGINNNLVNRDSSLAKL